MKRIILPLILSIAFSFAQTVARAELTGPTQNPYFVDGREGIGNDNNNGKSWLTPKKTIQAAVNAAMNDFPAQVWVRAGVYHETVTTEYVSIYGGFDGTESDRRDAKWWKNLTVIDGQGTQGSVVTLYFAKVDGFTIRNGGSGIGVSGDEAWISHNVIRETDRCVSLSDNKPGYSWITNNLLMDFDEYGIYNSRADVRCNTIVGNGSAGSHGIHRLLGNCISNIVTGCDYGVYDCPYTAFNHLWGNSVRDYYLSDNPQKTLGDDDISEDPEFAKPDPQDPDYRLCYGSLCINTGYWDDAQPVEVVVDLDGHPRDQGCDPGPCIDIGAYEYGVSEDVDVIIESPQGTTWTIEPCQTSQVIEISASTEIEGASIDHVDLWIDGVRADPAPTYNETTELWTCEWTLPCPLPSQVAIRIRATDTEGNYAESAAAVELELQESPSVIFIRPEDSCGTTHDGHSWLTAFHSVQQGVNAAASEDKSEVWVAEGEYDVSQYGLSLADGVAVYGGFELGQCAREERDWLIHPSTLTGPSSAPVVTADCVGSGTALDGFTLAAGMPDCGGGVYCTDSSSHCG